MKPSPSWTDVAVRLIHCATAVAIVAIVLIWGN
jgi:hypothetical protein